MINIYTKTNKELEEEQSNYNFAAHIVRGIPIKACPTYLIKRDGTRVDTKDLTEEQIINLIHLDIIDFYSPQGSYKRNKRIGLDAFKLLETINDTWKPSYDALIKIALMEKQYGHIIMDILGSMDKDDIIGKARTINVFLKQSNGDYSPTTNEEIITILKQMSKNEQMKMKQIVMKKKR